MSGVCIGPTFTRRKENPKVGSKGSQRTVSRVFGPTFKYYSAQHSSTIGLVLNHRTGSVTPQYHCVYDDYYTTVPNGEFAPVFDSDTFDADDWERLISNGGLERAGEPTTVSGNDTMFRLDDEWRSPADIERQRDEERQRRLERLADPEDLLEPPALLPREPPTLLRELDPQDDPFDLLVDSMTMRPLQFVILPQTFKMKLRWIQGQDKFLPHLAPADRVAF